MIGAGGSMIGGVAGLVLAAGGGRRYGGPKALVPYDGRLLVDRAVDVLRDGGCDVVAVILGAAADRVRAEAELARARVVVNPGWASGMGSSLRTGLDAAGDTMAACVLLVDTPGITPEAVRRVLRGAGPGSLAAATYHGERGHPVLLGRDHWPGVRDAARGDRGARDYLAHRAVALVPCEDIAEGTDLDRPSPPIMEPSAPIMEQGPCGRHA